MTKNGLCRALPWLWLRTGANSVTVHVDTTLLNRFAALRAAGDPRYQTGPTPLSSAPSGLLGPVTLHSVARFPTAAGGVAGTRH